MSASQLRLIAVIEALAGHEVSGLTLTEIARAAGGITASTVLRDLETLETVGWARRIAASKRWTLGGRTLQILNQFHAGLASAESRVAEVRANYTRTPI